MIIRIFGMTLLSVFLAFSTPASSQTAPPQSECINALRDGGYVIVFRHGATYQDQADTDPLNPSNVAKQASKSIGESMRKLKIPVGQDSPPFPAGDRNGRVDGFRRRESLR